MEIAETIKPRDMWMPIFVMVMSLLIALGFNSCQPGPIERLNDWMGWKDDHTAEEVVEVIIDAETNVDVDLTPRSPE